MNFIKVKKISIAILFVPALLLIVTFISNFFDKPKIVEISLPNMKDLEFNSQNNLSSATSNPQADGQSCGQTVLNVWSFRLALRFARFDNNNDSSFSDLKIIDRCESLAISFCFGIYSG